MQFIKHMYWSENIKNRTKVLWKLKVGAGMTDIYVISIAPGSNQLECTHCSYLKQRIVRNTLGPVIGIAKGKTEARSLLLLIFEECLEDTGTARVKEYLLGRIS